MKVVIEMDDLIQIIEGVASPPSLGEPLREQGFVPSTNTLPRPRHGHPKEFAETTEG